MMGRLVSPSMGWLAEVPLLDFYRRPQREMGQSKGHDFSRADKDSQRVRL